MAQFIHDARLQQPEDTDSLGTLALLQENKRIAKNRSEDIQTVMIVLSSRATIYDRDALRQKVLFAYPDAAVFETTLSYSLGAKAPQRVDLVVDFTGPKEMESIFHPLRPKRMSRFTVGRNAGWFRKRIYTRIFDERKSQHPLPNDRFDYEQEVQSKVLTFASIPITPIATATVNVEKEIALNLPPLKE